LKDVLESDDAGKIKNLSQDLTEAAMKLGEAIYKAQADAEGDADEPTPVDEDIVDADFEDLGKDGR
jgi:molecular chaperone DnaK